MSQLRRRTPEPDASPAWESNLIDKLRRGVSLVEPAVVAPGVDLPKRLVFGSPSMMSLSQVSRRAIDPAVIALLTAATTVAEEVEDLIQRFIGEGTGLGDLLSNPVRVLLELVTNLPKYGGAIGDIRALVAGIASAIQNFRPGLKAFLELDQAERSQAYAVLRRELDMDSDVSEELIERYAVAGLQVIAYGDDLVRVLIPQIVSLIKGVTGDRD